MSVNNKILFLIAIILFGVFAFYSPHLDQQISILPYNVVTAHFYGEVSLWCHFIYDLVPVITVTTILVSIVALLYSQRFSHPQKVKRVALVTLLTLAIGPGLLVNVVFKDHWGRARPYQVIRDHKEFTPFWQPRPNHPENNSFCGGHASIGFFLGVPLLAMGLRRRAILVSIVGGAVVGCVRILQGGHYFSDIVVAGVVVWIVAEIICYIIEGINKWKMF